MSIEDNPNDLNACSIVIRMEYDGISYLFTGDAERENESSRSWPQTNVLKAGHHGSSTSSSQKFLDQINACQKSAQVNLLNTQVDNHYEGSPQEAIDYANAILTDGACKINGGGFAGSIICFVRDHELKTFVEKMSERYGKDNVIELELRYEGPTAK